MVESFIELLREKALVIAGAESLTAGLASAMLARVPGASKVFWGSFVAYTREAKEAALGISGETLARHGLVSRETAAAMARGALEKSGADGAFSVTGLAGPAGDGSGLPVGTVWIGAALKNGPVKTERFLFTGSREEIREQAALAALRQLYEVFKNQPDF